MKRAFYVFIILVLVCFMFPFVSKWFYVNGIRPLYTFLLALMLSYVLVPAVEKLAVRYKLLDYPNERKVHKDPTPRIGGMAVFLAFMITILRNYHFPHDVVGVVIGACIIFTVGLLDDIFQVPAIVRLLAQVSAALAVVYFGVQVSFLSNFPLRNILEPAITVLWIVGITNAVNFLDGLDGLAAGISLIIAFCFFSIVSPIHQVESEYIIVALAGAVLGFLRYNVKPARIFLGDSGATLLGFLLSTFAVIGTLGAPNAFIAAVIPVLIFGIPIFDMIYTTVSRIRNGAVKTVKQWLEFTGKDHFHHRLLNIGFSETSAVFFLYFLNLCLGISAVVLRNAASAEALLLLVQAVIIFGIVSILMLAGRKVSA
jgi:UDP-GlcNAc:undecaprenyl-phosphate/decaprenyl-phosphate GlcNAc-1-phosphate transferase